MCNPISVNGFPRVSSVPVLTTRNDLGRAGSAAAQEQLPWASGADVFTHDEVHAETPSERIDVGEASCPHDRLGKLETGSLTDIDTYGWRSEEHTSELQSP